MSMIVDNLSQYHALNGALDISLSFSVTGMDKNLRCTERR